MVTNIIFLVAVLLAFGNNIVAMTSFITPPTDTKELITVVKALHHLQMNIRGVDEELTSLGINMRWDHGVTEADVAKMTASKKELIIIELKKVPFERITKKYEEIRSYTQTNLDQLKEHVTGLEKKETELEATIKKAGIFTNKKKLEAEQKANERELDHMRYGIKEHETLLVEIKEVYEKLMSLIGQPVKEPAPVTPEKDKARTGVKSKQQILEELDEPTEPSEASKKVVEERKKKALGAWKSPTTAKLAAGRAKEFAKDAVAKHRADEYDWALAYHKEFERWRLRAEDVLNVYDEQLKNKELSHEQIKELTEKRKEIVQRIKTYATFATSYENSPNEEVKKLAKDELAERIKVAAGLVLAETKKSEEALLRKVAH